MVSDILVGGLNSSISASSFAYNQRKKKKEKRTVGASGSKKRYNTISVCKEADLRS